MFNKMLKAAAIGVGIYLVGSAGKCVGYVKGAIDATRLCAREPEWCAEQGRKWNDIEKDWSNLKNKKA